MKPAREPRPTAYEVALEKGDYQRPGDLPCLSPFEQNLSSFILYWKWLGCPPEHILYRLLFWEGHQHDRQVTADSLGLSGREAVRKMIERLEAKYLQHKNPKKPASPNRKHP